MPRPDGVDTVLLEVLARLEDAPIFGAAVGLV
jgi:hypothetical protein